MAEKDAETSVDKSKTAAYGTVETRRALNDIIQQVAPEIDPFNVENVPAVNAIMVAAAVLTPNYTFYLLLIGPVKIKYIAGFFVVISFLSSIGGNAGGNIAHLGGAAIGWIYVRQLQKGTDLGAWVIQFMEFVQSFFKKPSNIKVTHRSEKAKTSRSRPSKRASSATSSKETSQEQIDAILDKISQSGYESLTKEEKQQLFNASKK